VPPTPVSYAYVLTSVQQPARGDSGTGWKLETVSYWQKIDLSAVEMKDCGCCKECRAGAGVSAGRDRIVVDGQRVHGRLVIVAMFIACLLPAVLLLIVTSYVHHQLLEMNSQLLKALDDCRCRQPIISQTNSPYQVNTQSEQITCKCTLSPKMGHAHYDS